MRRQTARQWVLGALAALIPIWAMPALATPYNLSWGGRMTEASGKPVDGPIDLEVSFYRSESGGDPVGDALSFRGVTLSQGVFQVTLSLEPSAFHQVFPSTEEPAWIEVKDATHDKTYPRQRLSMVPFAGKVPVDGKTIMFNGDGQLTVGPSSAPASGQFLTKDTSGNFVWATPSATASMLQGQQVSQTVPTSGQVLKYDGTQWVGMSDSNSGGTVTTVTATGPLSVTSPSTTPQLSISQASATVSGYLSSTDWQAFNGKQDALGFTPLNKAGDTMSGALNMGGNAVTSVGTPLLGTDAATKDYVDTAAGAELKKNGSTALTGNWAVGGFDITGVGNLGLSATKTLGLGAYTNAEETALVGTPLGAADKGKTWFNKDTNEVKYWNGSAAVALGVAGSGLANLNGETGTTQSFAVGTAGTAPAWSSASNTHTLSIPLASGAGVTRGLISKTDYDSFAGKLDKSGGTMTGAVNMGGNALTNLPAPSAASDAATMSYVDTSAGGRVPTTRLVSTGAGLSGGGDLSADRTLSLAIATNGALGGLKATTGKITLDGTGAITNIAADTATTATNFSGTLTGDVTGTQGATAVANVGGKTAAQVAGSVDATTAATDANTISTIVKRDGSGNFSAGTVTANLVGNVTGNVSGTAANVTGTVAIANGGTGATSANAALNALLPSQATNAGKVLQTDGTNAAWAALSTTNWDTAYTDRLKWDGGSSGLNATTGRASLQLGTAATLDVGVAASNVVQLDGSAKLPAVDGSQLTGVVTATTVDAAGAVMNGDFSTNGIMLRTGAGTYSILTDSSTNWNTAYTDRLKWDGGSTDLDPAAGRTSLGLGALATLGSISNANVDSAAAIDVTKLAGAGAANKGKVLAVDDSGAIAWQRSKDRSCDTGSANDVMVPVGTWCVDKYEASICSNADGSGTCYFTDGSTADFNYPNAGNLPASFNRDGSGTSAVYAVSKPDVIPARGMTWYQAAVACAMSGKQLIPDSVWQLAAVGTNDPGSGGGTGGVNGGSATDAAAAQCNTNTHGGSNDVDGNSLWSDASNKVRKTNRAGATSAGTNACLSRFGVADMVGNLWEWTDMNGVQAGTQAGFSQGLAQTPSALGKDDNTWNVNGSSYGYNGSTYGWMNGAPAAALRGGAWNDSAAGGVFALPLNSSGSYSGWAVGFRCARPR